MDDARTLPTSYPLPPSRREAGFTLAELMVTVVVTSIIALMISTSLVIMFGLTSKIKTRTEQTIHANYVGVQLESLLQNLAYDPRTEEPSIIRAKEDQLIVAVYPSDGINSTPEQIEISLEPSRHLGQYRLMKSRLGSTKKEVLIDHLTETRVFTYYTWSAYANNSYSRYGCLRPVRMDRSSKEVDVTVDKNKILVVELFLEVMADGRNVGDPERSRTMLPIRTNILHNNAKDEVIAGLSDDCWERIEPHGV